MWFYDSISQLINFLNNNGTSISSSSSSSITTITISKSSDTLIIDSSLIREQDAILTLLIEYFLLLSIGTLSLVVICLVICNIITLNTGERDVFYDNEKQTHIDEKNGMLLSLDPEKN